MKSILVTTREERQKALQRIKELGFNSYLFNTILTHPENHYISYNDTDWMFCTEYLSKFVTINPVGWKEFLGDSTPRFGGEEKFTVEEIRHYITSQHIFGYNLTAENIRKANDR